jgi:hypothetical protein
MGVPLSVSSRRSRPIATTDMAALGTWC